MGDAGSEHAQGGEFLLPMNEVLALIQLHPQRRDHAPVNHHHQGRRQGQQQYHREREQMLQGIKRVLGLQDERVEIPPLQLDQGDRLVETGLGDLLEPLVHPFKWVVLHPDLVRMGQSSAVGQVSGIGVFQRGECGTAVLRLHFRLPALHP